jgi:hypothetical protein
MQLLCVCAFGQLLSVAVIELLKKFAGMAGSALSSINRFACLAWALTALHVLLAAVITPSHRVHICN